MKRALLLLWALCIGIPNAGADGPASASDVDAGVVTEWRGVDWRDVEFEPLGEACGPFGVLGERAVKFFAYQLDTFDEEYHEQLREGHFWSCIVKLLAELAEESDQALGAADPGLDPLGMKFEPMRTHSDVRWSQWYELAVLVQMADQLGLRSTFRSEVARVIHQMEVELVPLLPRDLDLYPDDPLGRAHRYSPPEDYLNLYDDHEANRPAESPEDSTGQE